MGRLLLIKYTSHYNSIILCYNDVSTKLAYVHVGIVILCVLDAKNKIMFTIPG